MDISSSLTGTKEFRIVKRGYDPDEVNAFLDQIALGVGELKRKLAEAEDKAAAAKAQAAAPAAPAAPAPAPPPAPAPERSAEAEEIHRALILAQRAADEEVRKATEQGEEMLAGARAQAEELRREAEAEVARRREEGRAGLLAEIDELEQARDSLANDVVVLERHVEEQREVVQAAIGELQSLIDHPEAFRVNVDAGVSTAPPAIDRTPAVPQEPEPAAPTAAPAAAPAPAEVAAPRPAVEEEENLPGTTDLGKALAAADAPDEEPDEPAAPEAHTDTRPPRSPFEPAPAPAPAPQATPAAPPADAAPPARSDTTVPVEAPPPAPAPDLFTGPRGGDEDDRDIGPPTEALAPVDAAGDPDEDAFLAELRKAMLDDEPLGPRDKTTLPSPFDDDGNGGGGRRRGFGRRR